MVLQTVRARGPAPIRLLGERVEVGRHAACRYDVARLLRSGACYDRCVSEML
jgi:hypothetical protein